MSGGSSRRSLIAAWIDHDWDSAPVVVISAAALSLLAWLDVSLTHRVDAWFGACFVLVVLTTALAASRGAFFTAGILPPLLMVAIMIGVGALAPSAIAASGLSHDAGGLQRTIAGVVSHAGALFTGQVIALGVIGFRLWGAQTVPDR